MDISTGKETIGLLLLINQLRRTNRSLSRQTLVPIAELKLPRVASRYDELVQQLLDQNLADGTLEAFALTPFGVERVEETARHFSLPALFYNEYYQAVLHSQAHSEFCRRVYGLDLCQHGMADMAQLERMLAELKPAPGMKYLDFGCGDGRIAEHIAGITGMRVWGVDIACEAVELAQARTKHKRASLQFSCANLEKGTGSFPDVMFDHISAIDSLFFAQNQRLVLQILLDHLLPGGIMAVFYLCPPTTTPGETALGQALAKLGLPHSVCDLSAENKQHWILKKQVLAELEPQFQAEGAGFLYKNRLAECSGLDQFHRYLYIIQKPEAESLGKSALST